MAFINRVESPELPELGLTDRQRGTLADIAYTVIDQARRGDNLLAEQSENIDDLPPEAPMQISE